MVGIQNKFTYSQWYFFISFLKTRDWFCVSIAFSNLAPKFTRASVYCRCGWKCLKEFGGCFLWFWTSFVNISKCSLSLRLFINIPFSYKSPEIRMCDDNYSWCHLMKWSNGVQRHVITVLIDGFSIGFSSLIFLFALAENDLTGQLNSLGVILVCKGKE